MDRDTEKNDSYEKVFAAVQKNDLKQVQTLFYHHFRYQKFNFKRAFHNEELNRHITVLEAAAISSDKDMVAFLIEQGADYKCADEKHLSPILWAAQYGHLDIVNYLLDLGVDKETSDTFGRTAMIYAAQKGYLPIVQYMHEKGVDINACDKENPDIFPLYEAAFHGHTDVVAYLLEQGAEVDRRNCSGDTPLIASSGRGHSDVVKLLVEYGADVFAVNKQSQSASDKANIKGRSDVVNWLRAVEDNPEKFQIPIERRIADLSEKDLMCLPQSNPGLLQQIKKLDLFGRLFKALPYDKQVKLYGVVSSHMESKTQERVKDIIRDCRLQSGYGH